MQTFKTRNFVADWGFHLVVLAIALPLLGLAYLAWTALPTARANNTVAQELGPAHWRSGEVIAAFHQAGLPAEVVRGATKDGRDGFASLMVTDAVQFRLSDEDMEMGTVFCFKNKSDLERLKSYYQSLNESLPQFSSWLYVKDNVLLQINHEVPEEKARTYAAALDLLNE